ncbi:hypothetical protein [Siphonobacter sp.]|uniref:hypothetical protein n=1 Tax=Siphonobacter sp. TaxID=1869184 RepID=UPI003B3A6F13
MQYLLIRLFFVMGTLVRPPETYYYFLTATNDEIRTPGTTRLVYLSTVRTTDTYISASFLRNAQEDFAAQINAYHKHSKPEKEWFDTEIRTGTDEEEVGAERAELVKNSKADTSTRLVEFKE